MSIAFRCPNGHKLTCPDERAGQAGKCPKCGSIFHVPHPEHVRAEEQLVGSAVADSGGGVAVGLGTGSDEPSTADSGSQHIAEQTSDADAPPPDNIVFLCPNGHKLNAPSRLQGKPGKCPHCGEKFLVPVLEESADVSESGEFFDDMLGQESPAAASVQTSELVQSPADSGFNFGYTPEDEFTAGLLESGPQAMANLFARLWSQRGETGVVELYLKGGEILSPHWYAPQLSQHAYGMFAFQEQDGSHTMTAVHWEAVERIALRGMQELPEGVFES
jgi:rRNA maturation protein Nop10